VTKTKAILVGSFLLVFAAGGALGLLVSRPGAVAAAPEQRSGWLSKQLGLTPDQREQMMKIWADTMVPASKQQSERRSAAQQERDAAVQGILSVEQKASYEIVQKDYSHRMEESGQQWRKAIEAAQQQRDAAILALLPEEQKVRYEAIQKEYSRKMDELSQERKKAFDSFVGQFKRILNPEQSQKYEELLKQGDRGGPGGMRGPRGRRPASSSQPASGEAS